LSVKSSLKFEIVVPSLFAQKEKEMVILIGFQEAAKMTILQANSSLKCDYPGVE